MLWVCLAARKVKDGVLVVVFIVLRQFYGFGEYQAHGVCICVHFPGSKIADD